MPDESKRLARFTHLSEICLGLRLDRATVDWREVSELVLGSFAQTAPKKMVARL